MRYLLCLAVLLFACQPTPKPGKPVPPPATTQDQPPATPVFHIKARYWAFCEWAVTFTNDNFDTEEDIMQAFVIPGEVIHQLKTFKNQGAAIAFAQRFNTYAKCRRWNDSVARKAAKLKAPPAWKNPADACINQEGQAVLVH